jgi:stress-induced morphogen
VIEIIASQYKEQAPLLTAHDTLRIVPTPEEIKQRIEAAMPGAHASVEDFTGGGDHFRASVSAPAFAGRSRIEQHRMVYEIFDGEIGGSIHALSLKTQVAEALAGEPRAHTSEAETASDSAQPARAQNTGA